MHRPSCRSITLALVAGAFLAAGTVQAQPKAPPPVDARPPQAAGSTLRTIGWDDLVPKDWQPMAEFKGLDVSQLTDGDPRAQSALRRLREAWDAAPASTAMDGARIRLAGYVVALESGPEGLREFLLVPHFGACIHTPPPPANQIVHVRLKTPSKTLANMDAVWVSGSLAVTRERTDMGVAGYAMALATAQPYSSRSR